MRKDRPETLLISDPAVRLSLVAESLPMMVAYVDAHERYRFTSRAYEEALGDAAARGVLGRSVHEVVGDTAYQVLKPHIRKALAGEMADYEAKIPYDGDLRFVRARYIPDSDGATVHGYVALIENVTERQKAEHAYRDLAEKLELRVRERTEEILEKSKRLERFHSITIDREHDMIRLKREINDLLERLGEPKKYLTPPSRGFLDHVS